MKTEFFCWIYVFCVESVLEPDGEGEEDEEKILLQDLLAGLLLLEIGGEGEGEGDKKGILFLLLDPRRLLEGDKTEFSQCCWKKQS